MKFTLFAFSCLDQKPANLVYIETVSPIILAALWTMCILWTISVLLWIITIINFNGALEILRTKDNFDFTNFLNNRVMRCSTKGASHCCFRKAVSNNYFQNLLLINFISICSNVQNWPTETVRPVKWHFDTMEIIYLNFQCMFI